MPPRNHNLFATALGIALAIAYLLLHFWRSQSVNVWAIAFYLTVILGVVFGISKIPPRGAYRYGKYGLLLGLFLLSITLPYWVGGRGATLGWYDEIDVYIGWAAALPDPAQSFNPYWAGGSPKAHGWGEVIPLLKAVGQNRWLRYFALLVGRFWHWSLILFSIALLVRRRCESASQKAAVAATGLAILVAPRMHWGWVIGEHGLSFALMSLIVAFHFNSKGHWRSFLLLFAVFIFSVWIISIGLYESGKAVVLGIALISCSLIPQTKYRNLRLTLFLVLALFLAGVIQQYAKGIGIGVETQDFVRFAHLDVTGFYGERLSRYLLWIKVHVLTRPENALPLLYLLFSILCAQGRSQLVRLFLFALPIGVSISGILLAGALGVSVLLAYRYLTLLDFYPVIAFIALNLDVIEAQKIQTQKALVHQP